MGITSTKYEEYAKASKSLEHQQSELLYGMTDDNFIDDIDVNVNFIDMFKDMASFIAYVGKNAFVGTLPGDVQKKICGKDTWEIASYVSAMGEGMLGVAAVMSSPYLGSAIIFSNIMRDITLLGLNADRDNRINDKSVPVGSFFLEAPYRMVKAAYGYLKGTYENKNGDQKLDLVREALVGT